MSSTLENYGISRDQSSDWQKWRTFPKAVNPEHQTSDFYPPETAVDRLVF